MAGQALASACQCVAQANGDGLEEAGFALGCSVVCLGHQEKLLSTVLALAAAVIHWVLLSWECWAIVCVVLAKLHWLVLTKIHTR